MLIWAVKSCMVLLDYQISLDRREGRLVAYIIRVEDSKNEVHPRTGLEGPEGK